MHTAASNMLIASRRHQRYLAQPSPACQSINQASNCHWVSVSVMLSHMAQSPSRVDPHLFWGAKIFFPHREGNEGLKPEARRAETRGPRGRELGWGSWREGSEPPPHQLGVWGRCKLPQRGPGQSPGKFEIWCNLRPQNSLQKCLSKLLYTKRL